MAGGPRLDFLFPLLSSLSLSRDQNGTVLFVGRREGRKEEEAGLPLPYIPIAIVDLNVY